jgi:hypothetical protein
VDPDSSAELTVPDIIVTPVSPSYTSALISPPPLGKKSLIGFGRKKISNTMIKMEYLEMAGFHRQ